MDVCLCEGVFRIADFNGSPIAGPDQTDETQQVREGPGHVCSMITPGEVLSANLRGEKTTNAVYMQNTK